MEPALRETRVETVIAVLLAVADEGAFGAAAQARRVGDWAARIAASFPAGPTPEFAHRCGMLNLMAPDVLECVPDVAEYAGAVREFQSLAMSHPAEAAEASNAALILAVADEIDTLTFAAQRGSSLTLGEALTFMQRYADARTLPVVDAVIASLT